MKNMKYIWIVEKLVEESDLLAYTDSNVFSSEDMANEQFKYWINEIRKEYREHDSNEAEDYNAFTFVTDEVTISLNIFRKELNSFTYPRVERIMETTYENGTYWIEYTTDGQYGYELNTRFKPGDEKKLQELIIAGEYNVDKMECKPSIGACSERLGGYIKECLESENEMWFVENDEEISQEEILEIAKEVEKLGLEQYVTFYKDDCKITIYGGIITEFLF